MRPLALTVIALLSLTTFAAPAAAAPSLHELLGKVADSTRASSKAAADMVKAKQAYEEQQKRVIEAARALGIAFGVEAPAPRAPAPGSRLAALLSLKPTSRLQALLLPMKPMKPALARPIQLTPPSKLFAPRPSLAAKPAPGRPLPSAKSLALLKKQDPKGRSIYDSLTFEK